MEYLPSVYRVRWLRACARLDRWTEEVTYLTSEMSWFVAYMKHMEDVCEKRASAVLKVGDGLAAYDLRQADMWRRQGQEARIKFGWKSENVFVKGEESELLDVSDEESNSNDDWDYE